MAQVAQELLLPSAMDVLRANVCQLVGMLLAISGCITIEVHPLEAVRENAPDAALSTSTPAPNKPQDPVVVTGPDFEPTKDPIGPVTTTQTPVTQTNDVFVGDPPACAFEPPSTWPRQTANAVAVDAATLESQCHHDERGNWVCLISPATALIAGPCEFDGEGNLVVSGQASWPDWRAVPQASWPTEWETSALVFKYASNGTPSWLRVWHRAGPPAGINIAPWALTVDNNDNITWAGEDCIEDSSLPAAADGGYYDSCLDAYVVNLDQDGNPQWDLSFGTSNGLERVSDMRLAPDGGLYLAGQYHAPLQLPGHEDLTSNGGIDFYLMHLGVDRQVSWAQTWGSADHDPNGLRMGVSDAGDVAVSGSMGLMGNTMNGFISVVGADGEVKWEQQGVDLYITYISMLGDLAMTEIGGTLSTMDAQGNIAALPWPRNAGITRHHITLQGTIIAARATGDALWEIDPVMGVLRTHEFAGASGTWYQGGSCIGPNGEVGLSGTVVSSTDFGILDKPLEITAPTGFVVLLRDW